MSLKRSATENKLCPKLLDEVSENFSYWKIHLCKEMNKLWWPTGFAISNNKILA